MKYRIVEYLTDLYIVIGIGYNSKYDPPEVFYVVPLKNTLFKSVVLNLDTIEIPLSEIKEITDKKKLKAIWVLYGN